MITSLSMGHVHVDDPFCSTMKKNHDNAYYSSSSSSSSSSTPRLILACGMESGTLFFHDLAMLGGNRHNQPIAAVFKNQTHTSEIHSSSFTSLSLGHFPILGLDLVSSTLPPSSSSSTTHHPSPSLVTTPKKKTQPESNTQNIQSKDSNGISDTIQQHSSYPFVCIAGLAADSMSLLDLPQEDRGTVIVIKGTCIPKIIKKKEQDDDGDDDDDDDDDDSRVSNNTILTRIRARVGTCRIDDDDDNIDNDDNNDKSVVQHPIGKPGVNTVRFHPQGHIFAVGGWDKRIRLYSRTLARPLAVLRETHTTNATSITALDWSIPISVSCDVSTEHRNHTSDSLNMYLLASGSAEGRISLWHVFPM